MIFGEARAHRGGGGCPPPRPGPGNALRGRLYLLFGCACTEIRAATPSQSLCKRAYIRGGKRGKSWKRGGKLGKVRKVGNMGKSWKRGKTLEIRVPKLSMLGGGLSDWFMGDWPVPRNGTLLALDRKSLTFYA